MFIALYGSIAILTVEYYREVAEILQLDLNDGSIV